MKSIIRKPILVFAAVLVGLALLSILLAGFVSCNNASKDEASKEAEEMNKEKFDKEAEEDAKFVTSQVEGNMAEVKFAQLAQQKSTNAEIKSVASMLEMDHTSVLNDLKEYAAKKNISIPTQETQDARDKLTSLDQEKPETFDKRWCDELLDKHQKGIKTYEDAATSLNDAELKTWAANILPKLKMHHDKLEECKNKLK